MFWKLVQWTLLSISQFKPSMNRFKARLCWFKPIEWQKQILSQGKSNPVASYSSATLQHPSRPPIDRLTSDLWPCLTSWITVTSLHIIHEPASDGLRHCPTVGLRHRPHHRATTAATLDLTHPSIRLHTENRSINQTTRVAFIAELRVLTLILTKNSRTFRDHQTVILGPFRRLGNSDPANV